jgi:hypothetical protein
MTRGTVLSLMPGPSLTNLWPHRRFWGNRLHGLLVCTRLRDVHRPGSDGDLVFDRQHLDRS